MVLIRILLLDFILHFKLDKKLIETRSSSRILFVKIIIFKEIFNLNDIRNIDIFVIH